MSTAPTKRAWKLRKYSDFYFKFIFNNCDFLIFKINYYVLLMKNVKNYESTLLLGLENEIFVNYVF